MSEAVHLYTYHIVFSILSLKENEEEKLYQETLSRTLKSHSPGMHGSVITGSVLCFWQKSTTKWCCHGKEMGHHLVHSCCHSFERQTYFQCSILRLYARSTYVHTYVRTPSAVIFCTCCTGSHLSLFRYKLWLCYGWWRGGWDIPVKQEKPPNWATTPFVSHLTSKCQHNAFMMFFLGTHTSGI